MPAWPARAVPEQMLLGCRIERLKCIYEELDTPTIPVGLKIGAVPGNREGQSKHIREIMGPFPSYR